MPALADPFIAALGRLESERDLDGLVALFAENATVENPMVAHGEGAEGARVFWGNYREAFDEIRSDFLAVTESDGVAFLEWRSEGSRAGEKVRYGGVSVLEGKDGKITAFRTYFDPRRIPSATASGGEGTGRTGDAETASSAGSTSGLQPSGVPAGGQSDASPDAMEDAQRDAAEQRAAGGYN